MRNILKKVTSKTTYGLILALILTVASSRTSNAAVALTPTFYNTPTSTTTGIFAMTAGPDGNMWFTKNDQNQIGKVTMSGAVSEYTLGSGHTLGFGIAAGPDGNMWFNWANNDGTKGVGKMNTSGANQVYYDLTSSYGTYDTPSAIGAGPDGNMWIGTSSQQTSNPGGRIIKVTTSGSATVYPLPTTYPGVTYSIVQGSDGNMWFSLGSTDNSVNAIGSINMSGAITEHPLPGTGGGVNALDLGGDGNMWYLRSPVGDNKVGKLTPAGVATEYDITDGSAAFFGITLGPDNKIWIAETMGNKLISFSVTGEQTEYELPTDTSPVSIATGPDHNIWFGSLTKIGRILDSPYVPPTAPPPVNVKPPKTGALIGAVIASSAVIGIVVLAGIEVKKTRLENSKSSK